jgi:hypothetical protein
MNGATDSQAESVLVAAGRALRFPLTDAGFLVKHNCFVSRRISLFAQLHCKRRVLYLRQQFRRYVSTPSRNLKKRCPS